MVPQCTGKVTLLHLPGMSRLFLENCPFMSEQAQPAMWTTKSFLTSQDNRYLSLFLSQPNIFFWKETVSYG